jgi:hypothetical protein
VNLIWIDECGINRSSNNLKRWQKKSNKIILKDQFKGGNITIIMAIGSKGIEMYRINKFTTKQDTFTEFFLNLVAHLTNDDP